jgi:hypothetical protein
MDQNSLIQSYVRHKDSERAFFVSTIDRDSSAMVYPPPRYAETIVWEYDYNTGERGRIIYEDSCYEGSIRKHQEIAVQLREYGEIPDKEEED